MKTCPKCLEKKNLINFYQRKTGIRSGEYYEKCKNCMKLRGINYYWNNRDRQLPLAILRRHKAHKIKRGFINKVKDRSCSDCGMKYPSYVMDLDHMDRKRKITEVSKMVEKNWALEKIMKEVEKCEVVCANCHRIRTYKNLNLPR